MRIRRRCRSDFVQSVTQFTVGEVFQLLGLSVNSIHRDSSFCDKILFPQPMRTTQYRSQLSSGESWRSADGKRVARIARSPKGVTLAIDAKAAPGFGQFVVAQLPELYAAFARQKSKG